MMIGGLQRLTLLDYPGKTACTVFTSGCDLRCPFCHNALLVTKTDEIDSLPDTELFHLLSKRRGTLDGVCITGGEPLMQPGIEELMKQIKDRGFLVKLDTNGTYPKKLASVIKNGLADYIAMDIKYIDKENGKIFIEKSNQILAMLTKLQQTLKGKLKQ